MEQEETITKSRRKQPVTGALKPVHVIREGAVAASIWRRQSPSGYAYLDFSISRSWKTQATGKTGYSANYFARNRDELIRVIEGAAQWIEANAGQKADETPL